jgi:anti-sigma regulatory factor (Ser/Thr protein kinase)
MRAETASRPDGTAYKRSYPGTREQVREVRADLAAVVKGYPFADDFILLASELSTNAVMHSKSGHQGGVFTVRAEVRPGDYAWLEVEDQGGPWIERDPGEERGRGLALVACLAGEGNWAVQDGSVPGTRVVWARLGWPTQPWPGSQGANHEPYFHLPGRTAQGKGNDMIRAQCSCGFTELDDEEITDHLQQIFEPDDLVGKDGQVHEERANLTCACGLTVNTAEELDAHLLKAFTPDDATDRDGNRHEASCGT